MLLLLSADFFFKINFFNFFFKYLMKVIHICNLEEIMINILMSIHKCKPRRGGHFVHQTKLVIRYGESLIKINSCMKFVRNLVINDYVRVSTSAN